MQQLGRDAGEDRRLSKRANAHHGLIAVVLVGLDAQARRMVAVFAQHRGRKAPQIPAQRLVDRFPARVLHDQRIWRPGRFRSRLGHATQRRAPQQPLQLTGIGAAQLSHAAETFM